MPKQRSGDWEKRNVELIREVMANAGVITIAISPGFLDERRAIALVQELLR